MERLAALALRRGIRVLTQFADRKPPFSSRRMRVWACEATPRFTVQLQPRQNYSHGVEVVARPCGALRASRGFLEAREAKLSKVLYVPLAILVCSVHCALS